MFRVRLDKKTMPRQHGEYLSLTFAQKFLIGKCAAEDGVTATVQYYSKPLLMICQIHQFFSGRTVLVTCQFITTKVSLCRYLSICYPTNISPCMVYQYIKLSRLFGFKHMSLYLCLSNSFEIWQQDFPIMAFIRQKNSA